MARLTARTGLRPALAALLPVLGLALLPAGAAGQRCGLAAGPGVAGVAGMAWYDLGDGLEGPMLGGDLGVVAPGVAPGEGLEIRGGYRTVRLADGPDPHIGRLTAALSLPLPVPAVTLCPTLHAGGSYLVVDGAETTVTTGGVGLRLAARIPMGPVRAVPYGEVRGLAGWTTGTVLGLDFDASGYAFGGELGLELVLGALTIHVSGSMDGFADGLGLTPYPGTAAEAAIGVRF